VPSCSHPSDGAEAPIVPGEGRRSTNYEIAAGSTAGLRVSRECERADGSGRSRSRELSPRREAFWTPDDARLTEGRRESIARIVERIGVTSRNGAACSDDRLMQRRSGLAQLIVLRPLSRSKGLTESNLPLEVEEAKGSVGHQLQELRADG
jgi:hypothetical protein